MSFTWGYLGDTEIYGRQTDPSTYKKIDPNDETYLSYKHAGHILLYAQTKKTALKLYPRVAIALMQMRFDGYVGFPGGIVDEGENPAQGVTREMVEEVGWDSAIFGEVTQQDHLFTHVDEAKNLVLHFYAKELSEEKIHEIEKRSTSAIEHGDESLGLLHVPLYTMGDGYRGFPAFLRNNFIGNAKTQLINGLIHLKILTQEYVESALKAEPKTP